MAPPRIVARARRDTLGEGLWWSAREDAVYWVDILERRLSRLSLADNAVSEWTLPDVIGWVIERENGDGFVAGLGKRFVRLRLDPLAIEDLAVPDEPDGNRVNDAKADAAGRIWAGTMPFTCDRPSGGVYRIDPDGTATRVAADFTIPNGPAIPADPQVLLQTDTAKQTIYRYRIANDGALSDRTPFITFRDEWGSPDGMTVDADGGLWVACWGGSCVRRFDAEGRFDRLIELPASQITNVVFAGADLDRMFVTSAADGVEEEAGGCLFEVDPGCRGVLPHRYRG
jgi:sugar lactone lactonase YvrE